MPRPNVLLILNDDMGYSDLGCYGGEVHTPHLDRLAAGGLRFTQFYNTARCSPSRASLLTGLHPHQTGIGILTEPEGPEGYAGTLNDRCVTLAEVLAAAGWATFMSGKWHLCSDQDQPNPAWPCQRGFARHYGTITGAGSYFAPTTLVRDNVLCEQEASADPDYYYTDAISDQAAAFIRDHAAHQPDQPFFGYVAYTAPHWPLHAKPTDIARYRGRFDAGWDRLRAARLERMRAMGLVNPACELSDRDPAQPAWEDEPHQAWQARRMEVYAAQIDAMDQGIGRILAALEDTGQLENTLVIFLADNGGCAEEISAQWASWLVARGRVARGQTRDGRPVRIGNDPAVMPGGEDTYQSCGVPWANLSNTPFRYYKHWTHEGGIATPFIVHWPAGLAARGELRHQPAYLPDVMATVLELTGAAYPATVRGNPVPPCEGTSLVPAFDNHELARVAPMCWEHEGNAALRDGRWKLVRNFTGQRSATPGFDPPGGRGDWELYDLATDRSERHDLAAAQPERVAAMVAAYEAWAARCGVRDRAWYLEFQRRRRA